MARARLAAVGPLAGFVTAKDYRGSDLAEASRQWDSLCRLEAVATCDTVGGMSSTPEAISSDQFSPEQRDLIARVREKAFILYEGKRVPHRSCGIALAETFNLPTAPYQSLRRGGITGEGECGAIKAGELILGELLGDPNPTGMVTDALREAATLYKSEWRQRVDRGAAATGSADDRVQTVDIICNHLTAPLGDFMGPERQEFCTNIAAQVAEIVAEILVRFGARIEVTPIEGLD
jgi:hypothetical protein